MLNAAGIPAAPGAALSHGTQADVVNVAGVHVELKHQERIEIGAWMEQAERDAQRFGGWTWVFYRRNRESWHVAVPLDAWLEMYLSWIKGESDRDQEETPAQNTEGQSRPMG